MSFTNIQIRYTDNSNCTAKNQKVKTHNAIHLLNITTELLSFIKQM